MLPSVFVRGDMQQVVSYHYSCHSLKLHSWGTFFPRRSIQMSTALYIKSEVLLFLQLPQPQYTPPSLLWDKDGSYQINRTHLNTCNFTRYTFSLKEYICSAWSALKFLPLSLPFVVLLAYFLSACDEAIFCLFSQFYWCIWNGHFHLESKQFKSWFHHSSLCDLR